MAKVRSTKTFHDGFEDGFEPLEAIDLRQCQTVDDVVQAMSRCAMGGRRLGEAANVLEEMFGNDRCFKVLTISGAMTVAKLQLVFNEIIERGWADAIVATGALIAHGYVEGMGMSHFKYLGDMDDKTLYELGYDRVYDTLELEKNLYYASTVIEEIFMREELDGKSFTSPEICRMVGRHLVENEIGGISILKTAYMKNIPVYIPALNDSELGLTLTTLRHGSFSRKDRPLVSIDHRAFQDVEDFANRVEKQELIGLFTVGGGVPRNWAQQVAPYMEIRNDARRRTSVEFPRYYYGVRICPEPVHWGGLSGCTYSEGMSWGKFRPDGKYAEVYADATVVLPFLIKALMERFDKKEAQED